MEKSETKKPAEKGPETEKGEAKKALEKGPAEVEKGEAKKPAEKGSDSDEKKSSEVSVKSPEKSPEKRPAEPESKDAKSDDTEVAVKKQKTVEFAEGAKPPAEEAAAPALPIDPNERIDAIEDRVLTEPLVGKKIKASGQPKGNFSLSAESRTRDFLTFPFCRNTERSCFCRNRLLLQA